MVRSRHPEHRLYGRRPQPAYHPDREPGGRQPAGPFIFDDQATLPGIANNIDGKAGIDTLDYSAYTTDVTVDLQSGIATGVKNGVSEIENVIGSLTGINNLYGDNGDNTFTIIGSGNYFIYGRGGNDTYIFAADTNPLGSVTIYEDAAHGGSGVDTISFAPTPRPLRRDGGPLAGISARSRRSTATCSWRSGARSRT